MLQGSAADGGRLLARAIMGGVFMFILKDPERARAMGLIGAKAQITAGVADWPTYLGVMAQAVAVGGSLLFALVTAWVFGREFADRTKRRRFGWASDHPPVH